MVDSRYFLSLVTAGIETLVSLKCESEVAVEAPRLNYFAVELV